MDILSGLRLARRWWWLFACVVAVAIPLSSVLATSVQPEFRARATVLFAGPTERISRSDTGKLEPVNPLTEQPAALETAAVVSSLALDTEDVAALLTAEGLTADYGTSVADRSPLLTIESRAGSHRAATAAVVRLAELVSADVRERQSLNTRGSNMQITTRLLGTVASGGDNQRSALRIQVLIVLLTVLSGLALCTIAERVAGRRRESHGLVSATADVPAAPS